MLYQDDAGRMHITNGVMIWDDSEERRQRLEWIDHLDLKTLRKDLERYQPCSDLTRFLQEHPEGLGPVDLEYLSRPLVKGLRFQLHQEGFKIVCDSAVIAQVRRQQPLFSKKLLLEQYRRILTLARKNKVKIAYKERYRSRIQNQWETYQKAAAAREELYKKLFRQAQFLQQRGIHQGYRDDVALQQWNDLYAQYDKTFWHSSVCFQMETIAAQMNRLEELLSQSDGQYGHVEKIYL